MSLSKYGLVVILVDMLEDILAASSIQVAAVGISIAFDLHDPVVCRYIMVLLGSEICRDDYSYRWQR